MLGVFKCVVLFYAKYFITKKACYPPIRQSKARVSLRALIFGVMAISMVLVVVPFGYLVSR
jgi:hypothetical protein